MEYVKFRNRHFLHKTFRTSNKKFLVMVPKTITKHLGIFLGGRWGQDESWEFFDLSSWVFKSITFFNAQAYWRRLDYVSVYRNYLDSFVNQLQFRHHSVSRKMPFQSWKEVKNKTKTEGADIKLCFLTFSHEICKSWKSSQFAASQCISISRVQIRKRVD